MGLDVVAVTLLVTFVVMMTTGAITVLSRRPPLQRHQVTCPEDQQQATVGVSWDRGQRRMLVAECDHRHWREGHCHKTCEAFVQKEFSELTPLTVLP